MSRKKQKKGLSLIETASALAVSALIVAGATTYYVTTMRQNQSSALIAAVQNGVGSLETLYADNPSLKFQYLSTPSLAALSLFPHWNKNKNQWIFPSGDVILGVGKFPVGSSTNARTLLLRLQDGSSCHAFALGTFPSPSFLYAMYQGGNDPPYDPASGYFTAEPTGNKTIFTTSAKDIIQVNQVLDFCKKGSGPFYVALVLYA